MLPLSAFALWRPTANRAINAIKAHALTLPSFQSLRAWTRAIHIRSTRTHHHTILRTKVPCVNSLDVRFGSEADILTSPTPRPLYPQQRTLGGASKSAFGCWFMSTRPSGSISSAALENRWKSAYPSLAVESPKGGVGGGEQGPPGT